VRVIKKQYTDCAVTLSLGERSFESYRALRGAGADRYLLRHESANAEHYAALHPPEQTFITRRNCLLDLKALGYQTGCGFMVGSPGQTTSHIADDLVFIKTLDPEMVGVGPFIPHTDTPFANDAPGELALMLNVLAILRLMKPGLLLPATTALGTIAADGREQGVEAGANVIMLNISPPQMREKYALYDNKICAFEDAADKLKKMNCEFVVSRGDYAEF
jgi:biotin synthase